ncbi:MAG: hypothetical protein LBH05_04235 [Deferribacteraceae bacterium]|jgi:hypothetical protein|nr:hypothetical protein [Deferribacteraceae bacterium]
MKSPQIHCIIKKDKNQIADYLKNIGALATDNNDASIILTDNPDNMRKGRLCFLLADKPLPKHIYKHINISPSLGNQKIYETISQIVNAIQNFQNVEDIRQHTAISEDEVAIVGSFAKHFSHNVLNSLLAAVCFLRQLKPLTEKTEHTDSLWRVVDEKLRFIEELVNGYNDYNHVLNLKMTEELEVSGFYNDLIVAISEKTFGKAFSAYLSFYTSRYNMTYDLQSMDLRTLTASPLFLKLAFCYIIKDTIQYLSFENTVAKFHVVTQSQEDKYTIQITVENISMPQEILNTMFRPWDHQMFAQSFDYWGMAIAHTIIAEHEGTFIADNINGNLVYKITL